MKLPEFQPKSILDFGTGPGTASFAIRTLEKESERKFSMINAVDVNQAMLDIANQLFELTNIKESIELSNFMSANPNVTLVPLFFFVW